MRHVLRGFAIAAAVSVSASFALAGDEESKTGWEGFGVGTFIVQKSTTQTSGPGIPESPATTSESRMTLVKITDEAHVVKSEQKAGDEWLPGLEFSYPRKVKPAEGKEAEMPKPEDLGEEKLTIDGQELACKKQKVVFMGITTILWEHSKHGTVKSESTAEGQTISSIVTKLAGKAKIGSVEVEYQETVVTSKEANGGQKSTTWKSDAIPGGSLRMEVSSDSGGVKMTMLTETVSFEKK